MSSIELLNVLQYWGNGYNEMPLFIKIINKYDFELCKKNNINLIRIDDNNVNNYITPNLKFNPFHILNITNNQNLNFTKNDIKFIHITKTAGTTIENIGNENNYKWGMYDKDYLEKFKNISNPEGIERASPVL
mgnify:CR=1 FL=1